MFSLNNFKSVKLLHDKKNRLEESLYIAEGSRLIHDLLIHNPTDIIGIYATNKWIETNHAKLQNFLKLIVDVSERQLQSLASLKSTNEVLAVLKFPVFGTPDFRQLPKISLYLDHISDPGNYGTIVRTADWFGINTIFCSANCADRFNSKVVQASMGSVARINILLVEYSDLVKEYNNHNIVGADLSGTHFKSFTPDPSTIICLGNEANGLSDDVRSICSQFIHIPSYSLGAESLNVAISAGILMSEYCK